MENTAHPTFSSSGAFGRKSADWNLSNNAASWFKEETRHTIFMGKAISRTRKAASPRRQRNNHEAPAPNGQKAQPPAAGLAREALKAIDDEAARFTPGRLTGN
jgi:hypothetical protein